MGVGIEVEPGVVVVRVDGSAPSYPALRYGSGCRSERDGRDAGRLVRAVGDDERGPLWVTPRGQGPKSRGGTTPDPIFRR